MFISAFYIIAFERGGLLYTLLYFFCSYVPSLNVFVPFYELSVVLAGTNHFSIQWSCIFLIILVIVCSINDLYCGYYNFALETIAHCYISSPWLLSWLVRVGSLIRSLKFSTAMPILKQYDRNLRSRAKTTASGFMLRNPILKALFKPPAPPTNDPTLRRRKSRLHY